MAIEKNSFGKMPDGTEVYKYTLTNKNGVSASFITLGGVWVSMVVPDKDGIMADVVLGYDDLDSTTSAMVPSLSGTTMETHTPPRVMNDADTTFLLVSVYL